MHKSGEFVSKALCAGVRGYVLKDNALEELIECIELVYANKIYLSQDITGIVVEGFVHNSRETVETGESAISPREREILQLLAEGKSNKDISDLLNLSIKTVETHRANIMRKLNFKNITDLVLYAVRNHIIEP
jgi:DNA-binding NarL/FixJ family response regulator